MVDGGPGRSRDAGGDGRYEPMPRWVKALLVVGGLVAVAVLVMLLSGGGHGPARHMGMPAGSAGSL